MNNTLSTEIKNTGKIAAFDFDHTLVRPLNGKFPKDVNDWTFLYLRGYI